MVRSTDLTNTRTTSVWRQAKRVLYPSLHVATVNSTLLHTERRSPFLSEKGVGAVVRAVRLVRGHHSHRAGLNFHKLVPGVVVVAPHSRHCDGCRERVPHEDALQAARLQG